MSWFNRKSDAEFERKRLAAIKTPDDANEPLIAELRQSYPYMEEAFGIKSLMRVMVWTVLEMKKRGLL